MNEQCRHVNLCLRVFINIQTIVEWIWISDQIKMIESLPCCSSYSQDWLISTRRQGAGYDKHMISDCLIVSATSTFTHSINLLSRGRPNQSIEQSDFNSLLFHTFPIPFTRYSMTMSVMYVMHEWYDQSPMIYYVDYDDMWDYDKLCQNERGKGTREIQIHDWPDWFYQSYINNMIYLCWYRNHFSFYSSAVERSTADRMVAGSIPAGS